MVLEDQETYVKSLQLILVLVVGLLAAGGLRAADIAESRALAGDSACLKEKWPAARTLVWAKPGTSDVALKPANWTEYASGGEYLAGKPGRPAIEREIRDLIRRMSRENPTWGAPRILSELLLLGHDVAEATVAKYMVRTRKPPSQTWRTFLDNHVPDIAACDFFTVPTVTFRVLYVFIVLRHDRRQVVHFNVTTNPYAEWTAQQIINAFPYEEAPGFLIRDRDDIYGDHFTKRVEGLGIEEVPTAPRSPWQNPYCERVIGSIRRECLDHMIVLNERHLYRILTDYFDYYHHSRPHLSLDRNSPTPRDVEAPSLGEVVSIPQVGGLHHRYTRAA